MSGCALRSRSAAISPTTACSRCSASAIAGISPSIRASSATPRVRSSNSTPIRGWSSNLRMTSSVAVRKAGSTNGDTAVLVAPPDVRPYVRMITERMFPTLPVLSHVEIARREPR